MPKRPEVAFHLCACRRATAARSREAAFRAGAQVYRALRARWLFSPKAQFIRRQAAINSNAPGGRVPPLRLVGAPRWWRKTGGGVSRGCSGGSSSPISMPNHRRRRSRKSGGEAASVPTRLEVAFHLAHPYATQNNRRHVSRISATT